MGVEFQTIEKFLKNGGLMRRQLPRIKESNIMQRK